MPSFKLPNQFLTIAPGKDARALINDYRAEKLPQNSVAAQSLENLQQSIDSLRGNMGQIQDYFNYLIQQGAIALPITTVAETTVRDQTLTAATTAITQARAATAGQWLVLFLIQDATGGRKITWGATLKAAPVDIAPIASTYSQFVFVSRVDPADSSNINWFYVPLLLSGITP